VDVSQIGKRPDIQPIRVNLSIRRKRESATYSYIPQETMETADFSKSEESHFFKEP